MSNDNTRILSQPISYQELLTTKNTPKIRGIYKIENLINHKVYIGQSTNIILRLKHHTTLATNNHLHNSFEKYGFDNFSFEVLKETYDLDYWEMFLIQLYEANNSLYGYNVAIGGQSGDGNWIYLPKEKQDEIKQKISKANKGKVISEEHKAKISKIMKGRPSPNKGNKFSEESRKKESVSQRKRYENPEARKRVGNGVKSSEKYQQSRKNPEFRKRMSEVNLGRVCKQETREKIRQSHLGKKMPEEFSKKISKMLKGRKLSDNWKRKISEANKGKEKDYIVGSIWWNNGKKNYRSKECPFEGCVRGRLNFNNVGSKGMKWWTNDIVEVLSKECPKGYHKGKLPMKEETKKKLSIINTGKTRN